MKRLAFLLLFLASPAFAQDFHETILRPVTSQGLVYGTTSANGRLDTSGLGTRIISLMSTTDAFLMMGASNATVPTATTGGDSMALTARVKEYIKVSPGSRYAVIGEDTPGTLYITEFSP